MREDATGRGVTLAGQRERAIEALCMHFAADRLTLEEFERRVDAAHRAGSVPELEALTQDLPAAAAAPPAPVAAVPGERARRQLVFSFMGGAERRGRWRPARSITVFAAMGGAELDFRDAVLEPGVTDVFVACIMGGVDVIVPPDLAVDANGIAIMGGFEHRAETDPAAAGGHLLRIRGLALMGGVDVQIRQPGESASDARRRRRAERHTRRRSRW